MSGDFRRIEAASFLCLIVFSLFVGSIGAANTIPLPRERPGTAPAREALLREAAAAPSPCQRQLAEFAVFEPLPPIEGPGECKATDVVKVDAVRLPEKRHVTLAPPATLRCAMAEAVAQWIAKDVAPAITTTTGASLRGIETVDSFECRTRNGISGAKISEHGRANALDVRSFKLSNAEVIELNNPSVPKSLRDKLRDSACARFPTVLGNGADAYHSNHVHIDMIERSNHYKICQWDVLNPAETIALAREKTAAAAARLQVRSLGQQGLRGDHKEAGTQTAPAQYRVASSATPDWPAAKQEAITVGPWNVATSYKGDRFVSCSMARSTGELNITFLRTQDGLSLLLASQKWRLEQGKAYPVRLIAGSRSVDATASAGLESVTVALPDEFLSERLRTANVLEVRGEGATLRVPLDGSTAALERLEVCFNKNSRSSVETNPFVAPSRKP